MEKMRSLSNNMFAKVLIILIAISFIFVGFTGSFNNNTIATVNDTEINKSTIASLYRNTINQPNFPKLSTAQLKSFGVVENILEKQINFISQYTKADEIGISVSDKFMVNRLAGIEQFQSLGRFDKMKFQQILNSNNLSVEQFTRDLRREEIANRYSLSFNKIKFNSTNINKLLNRNDNQSRNIITAEIKTASIPVNDITDKKLKDFYNDNKNSFEVPESRNVKILEISPETVAKTITTAQAKEFFNNNKNIYEKAETRDYYLIPGEKDKLLEVKKSVASGTKVSTAVKDILGLKYSDLLNKDKDLDSTAKNIQDAVFKGKIGAISDPIDMVLNNVIIVVDKISPKQTKSFVAIEKQIKTDMAKNQILDLTTTAEDELSEDKSIDEIAKAVGLKTSVVNKVSKSNNKALSNPKIIETIFQTATGEVSFPVELSENKFALVSVDKITASYIPKYNDIKQKVKTAYIAKQRNNKIQQITRDITKAKSPTEFTKIAKKLKFTVKNKTNLKKSGKLHQSIFDTNKGGINSYQKDGKLIAFFVRDIKIPAKSNNKKSLLVDGFAGFNENQNFFSAFNNIRNNQNIDINQSVINEIYEGK